MKPSCMSFYMVLVVIGFICLSIPGKTHGKNFWLIYNTSIFNKFTIRINWNFFILKGSSLVTRKQGVEDLGKICTTDEDCGTFQECKDIDEIKAGEGTCQFNWDWKPILLIGFAVIVVIMGVCLCLFCLPCCAVAGCLGCCC